MAARAGGSAGGGPESGRRLGWRREGCAASWAAQAARVPGRRSAKAASARRPIVSRSSRSAPSWIRQVRRQTLVAREAEVRQDAPDGMLMKALGEFLKNTLIGGLLIVVPMYLRAWA